VPGSGRTNASQHAHSCNPSANAGEGNADEYAGSGNSYKYARTYGNPEGSAHINANKRTE
jgi:hypothetical protein